MECQQADTEPVGGSQDVEVDGVRRDKQARTDRYHQGQACVAHVLKERDALQQPHAYQRDEKRRGDLFGQNADTECLIVFGAAGSHAQNDAEPREEKGPRRECALPLSRARRQKQAGAR